MANRYNVSVINRSGAEQNYIIFTESPKVIGPIQGKIWPGTLDASRTPCESRATFSIFKQAFAVSGTSSSNPSDGATVKLTGIVPVDLGRQQDDDRPIPGTTLALEIRDGTPYFSSDPPDQSSYPNAFEIDTASDFYMEDAVKNNFLIGLGSSPSGPSGRDVNPTAVFVPQPEVKYQIKPANVYYVSYGDYAPGVLIDAEKLCATVKIDFDNAFESDVKIVHDAHGLHIVKDNY